MNFVTSCMGIRDPAVMDRIWSVIEAANQKKEQQLQHESEVQSFPDKRTPAASDQPDSRQDPDKKKRLRKELTEENGKSSNDGADTGEKDVTCDDMDGKRIAARIETEVDLHPECGDGESETKFSWKKAIKRIVRERTAGGKDMPLKDLQRQVSQLNPFPPPPSTVCHILRLIHVLVGADRSLVSPFFSPFPASSHPFFPFTLPSIRYSPHTRSRRRKIRAYAKAKPIRMF